MSQNLEIKKDGMRNRFKNLYDIKDTDEIIRVCYDFCLIMLVAKKTSLECYLLLHDMGVKPEELGAAIALALEKIPNDLLNGIDQKVKKKSEVLFK